MNPKLILVAIAAMLLNSAQIRAETVSLYDADFVVLSVPSGSTFLSVRWGTWDAGTSTFTQQIFVNNDGYVDLAAPEFAVTINQTTNATYAAGTLLAMAIFTNGSSDASSLSWSNSYT